MVKTGSGPAATIEVTGVAGAFRQPAGPLDCGNSGSTMRMLAGLIASASAHLYPDRGPLADAAANGAYPQAAECDGREN